MLRLFLGVSLLFLTGCATVPPQTAPAAPRHHVARVKPRITVTTIVPVPPATVQTPAPAPQETFKHRWLNRFWNAR